MSVTLIGIRPGRIGRPALKPTKGRSSSADRLRVLLCLSVKEFEAKFPNRANVFNRTVGSRLMARLSGPVYVLGREAWYNLGLPRTDFFGVVRCPGASFRLIPHPSGRNLMYNDPALRRRVRRLLCHTP